MRCICFLFFLIDIFCIYCDTILEYNILYLLKKIAVNRYENKVFSNSIYI